VSVYRLDPVLDPRWTHFIDGHARASVFHSPAWLEALRRTYGYEPLALTTSAPGTEVRDGLLACHVKSWFAERLVSLPFSDHCEPLVDQARQVDEILAQVKRGVDAGAWRSAELRPESSVLVASGLDTGSAPRESFWLHRLDLTPGLDALFARFHRSCVQRAIRRAERAGVQYEAGSSEPLLGRFYGLLRLTRRRHGIPPQPFSWFRNLVACFGERLTIRIASKDRRPIAGMLTLAFRTSLVYKYGGSDATFHRFGGMPFLFWKLIQEAKMQGFHELDLGRSEIGQPGLIAFKDRLGASRTRLTYYSYPPAVSGCAVNGRTRRVARHVFRRLPDPALSLAGRLLYRQLNWVWLSS
jgi:hypothetical protein